MRKVVCASIAVSILKLLIALFTVGTNDSLTWEHDLAKLRTGGFAELYREGVQYSAPSGMIYPRQAFIHPAAVVNGLRGLGLLEDASGLPLRFWLRFTCVLADIGMLVIVWKRFGAIRNGNLVALMAISPISVLVSGFHANTDPIMIFFVVASVFLLMARRVTWAGVMFGLAASVKLVPIIFIPAFLLELPSLRDRVKWICIGVLTWIAVSMPYLAEEPVLILRRIFGYESATGLWGFYLLASMFKGTSLAFLYDAYAPAAKWIALLVPASLPVIIRLLRARLCLFGQCGLVVFVFLFLSPGFGVQYLAWTVPWLVVLGLGPMAAYYAVAGACILAVYTAASGGININAFADSFHVSMGMRILIRLVWWLAIGTIAVLYVRLAWLTSQFIQRGRAELRQRSPAERGTD